MIFFYPFDFLFFASALPVLSRTAAINSGEHRPTRHVSDDFKQIKNRIGRFSFPRYTHGTPTRIDNNITSGSRKISQSISESTAKRFCFPTAGRTPVARGLRISTANIGLTFTHTPYFYGCAYESNSKVL